MEKKQKLERRIGTFQAITINMAQMMGAGPFITIPLVLSVMGGHKHYLDGLLAPF